MERANLQAVGARSASVQPAGDQLTVVQPISVQPTGVRRTGVQLASVQPAGGQRAARKLQEYSPQMSILEPCGPVMSARSCAAARLQPTGLQTAHVQPRDVQPTGVQSECGRLISIQTA